MCRTGDQRHLRCANGPSKSVEERSEIVTKVGARLYNESRSIWRSHNFRTLLEQTYDEEVNFGAIPVVGNDIVKREKSADSWSA